MVHNRFRAYLLTSDEIRNWVSAIIYGSVPKHTRGSQMVGYQYSSPRSEKAFTWMVSVSSVSRSCWENESRSSNPKRRFQFKSCKTAVNLGLVGTRTILLTSKLVYGTGISNNADGVPGEIPVPLHFVWVGFFEQMICVNETDTGA